MSKKLPKMLKHKGHLYRKADVKAPTPDDKKFILKLLTKSRELPPVFKSLTERSGKPAFHFQTDLTSVEVEGVKRALAKRGLKVLFERKDVEEPYGDLYVWYK